MAVKFKRGDKVRRIHGNESKQFNMYKGRIYTVWSHNENDNLILLEAQLEWDPSYFELVSKPRKVIPWL